MHFIVYHKYGKRSKRSETLNYIGSTGSIHYTNTILVHFSQSRYLQFYKFTTLIHR